MRGHLKKTAGGQGAVGVCRRCAVRARRRCAPDLSSPTVSLHPPSIYGRAPSPPRHPHLGFPAVTQLSHVHGRRFSDDGGSRRRRCGAGASINAGAAAPRALPAAADSARFQCARRPTQLPSHVLGGPTQSDTPVGPCRPDRRRAEGANGAHRWGHVARRRAVLSRSPTSPLWLGAPPPPPLTPPLAVSHAASEAPPCVSWLSCRRCDGAWQSIAAGQRGGGARAWRGAGRGAAAAPMPGKSADAGSVADRLAPLLSSHAVVTGLEGGGGCGQNRLAVDWKGKPIIPARRDSFTLQFAACGHSAPPNDTSGVQ